MKITVGHKVINLEELFQIAFLGAPQAELAIDAQLYAELSTTAPKDKSHPEFVPFQSGDAPVLLNLEQTRAVLLAKLVQLLKLKKNCQKTVADFIGSLLNEPEAW